MASGQEWPRRTDARYCLAEELKAARNLLFLTKNLTRNNWQEIKIKIYAKGGNAELSPFSFLACRTD